MATKNRVKLSNVLFDGKSVSVWDADNMTGWEVYGQPVATSEGYFYKRVPWLYRAVRDRANLVGNMPFAILKGSAEYDVSGTYENKLKWLPNPAALFKRVEMALAMFGKCYLFLETNGSGYIKAVKYINPTTIIEKVEPDGSITYKRKKGRVEEPIKNANIVAFYDTDCETEAGAPDSSAAKAGLAAAGVLYNSDTFIASFFARGAIKATVLSTINTSAGEAERLQHWWDDVVAGIKNAWAAIVLRGEGVKPTVIGEGLESLTNDTLTTERRQDIATALGVPESRLWSSAANYATSKEDMKSYYNGTIIPECDLIAEAFNAQVFNDEHKLNGYRIEFRSETLDVFKADNNEQAQAASAFGDLFEKYPTFDLFEQSLVMLGFQLPQKLLDAAKEYYADKEKRAEEMQENVENAETGQTSQDEPGESEQPEQLQPPKPAEVRAARAAWKRKAIRSLERGESAAVEFATSALPEREQAAIRYELEGCKTVDEIKVVFENAEAPTLPADPWQELKRTRELLEALANG